LHYDEMRLRSANPFSVFEIVSRADSPWLLRPMNHLELDYEQARWAAIFTAESGFFLAARLRRLFLMPFAEHIREEEKPPLIL
jgi:hypothetical protein